MIDFLRGVIRDRMDYLKLLQLSLVYLGGWSGDPPRFRALGAYHQARWMAKAIYILKIALFSQQLQLTRSEKRGVQRLPVSSVSFTSDSGMRQAGSHLELCTEE